MKFVLIFLVILIVFWQMNREVKRMIIELIMLQPEAQQKVLYLVALWGFLMINYVLFKLFITEINEYSCAMLIVISVNLIRGIKRWFQFSTQFAKEKVKEIFK